MACRIVPPDSMEELIVNEPEDITLQVNFTDNEVILMMNGFIFYTFEYVAHRTGLRHEKVYTYQNSITQ